MENNLSTNVEQRAGDNGTKDGPERGRVCFLTEVGTGNRLDVRSVEGTLVSDG